MNRRPGPVSRNHIAGVGVKTSETEGMQIFRTGAQRIPTAKTKKTCKIGLKDRKTYEDALELFERQRSKENSSLDSCIPIEGTENSMAAMMEWLECLAHTESEIDTLNVIHVAGTKGKGSTCAFTYSFLRAHGQRTGYPKRIGLYTSPDLGCVEERLRINDKPISKDLFTKYTFEVWDRLQVSTKHNNRGHPSKVQLLALVSIHTFIKEGADAAIYETHRGGKYDATNVIQRPTVTAITSIGTDNALHLSPSIDDIAWHKAGIFKQGVPALSTPQEDLLSKVLLSLAAEKKTMLEFVQEDALLQATMGDCIDVPVQRANCTLALAIARVFLKRKAPNHCINALDISKGLQTFSCPGRFEIIHDLGGNQWFLDAAYNETSLRQAVEWFTRHTASAARHSRRAVIFSHSWTCDGLNLLRYLANVLTKNRAQIHAAYFCTYIEQMEQKNRPTKPDRAFLGLCDTYSTFWRSLTGGKAASVKTVEEALFFAGNAGLEYDATSTLVIGSLELTGSARRLLGRSVNGVRW